MHRASCTLGQYLTVTCIILASNSVPVVYVFSSRCIMLFDMGLDCVPWLQWVLLLFVGFYCKEENGRLMVWSLLGNAYIATGDRSPVNF